MRKVTLSFLLAFLVLTATLSLIQIARGQAPGAPNIMSREMQGENQREIQGGEAGEEPQQPSIGSIDSPSATCYQPEQAVDECYLSWYYLAVDAAPSYMLTMTLTLNAAGPVAHTQGFFQSSMYIPGDMTAPGYKVTCGWPQAGVPEGFGNSYNYTIRARESTGLTSANYGTVTCPADTVNVFLPILPK